MSEEKNTPPTSHNAPPHQTSFVTKVVITVVGIIAVISFLTPNTDALTRFDTPANQLYFLSFIQNPEALWMASEIQESEKKYDKAQRSMRLALGLLEMNNANPTVIKRYTERLETLKTKQ